ncbi:hypothetical protein AMAG_08541 [Allomyces macrogynus ATCC 38327]|uniref:tRNA-splicing endonuclease subunit Sen54 N-terminal domain-containing protein n=1 Tax=Allomyces macrogynus (strain ATCC 38327) TaxID=578462 RepID=A0A0L0SLX7_ALLM3|nr:hypothetical protein AMAG_08541 [Allomyces macrogynus ATCC 38327]|eukprot:KNE63409.1 hypothetical protein AMAG_08541 [Allomyces macrogynus ATCC 38327]
MEQHATTAPDRCSDRRATNKSSASNPSVSAKVPLSDLDAALAALEASLAPPVANPITSPRAIWLPDRAIALVTVPKGTLLTRMGRRDKSDLYLWPEEAMFLVARGDLLIDDLDGVDQCFEKLIVATQSTDRYSAYCELKQAGYIVARAGCGFQIRPSPVPIASASVPVASLALVRAADPPPLALVAVRHMQFLARFIYLHIMALVLAWPALAPLRPWITPQLDQIQIEFDQFKLLPPPAVAGSRRPVAAVPALVAEPEWEYDVWKPTPGFKLSTAHLVTPAFRVKILGPDGKLPVPPAPVSPMQQLAEPAMVVVAVVDGVPMWYTVRGGDPLAVASAAR